MASGSVQETLLVLDSQRGQKVVVAMSGGVDSSVAAARLVEAGCEVVGITTSLYCHERENLRRLSCCGPGSARDARRVADHLGIPHYILDFTEVFEREVIAPFCEAYLSGRTPNPCVDCNRLVRFRHLLAQAIAFGASHLATGHYALVERDEERGRWVLARGCDAAKDQSYFLWGLTQEVLAHTLFPLGAMRKEETREYARRLGLQIADKRESQEICFVPAGGHAQFVAERTGGHAAAGPIYDSGGRLLGKHRGLPHYTIGQRSGTGVALGRPVYVIAINPEENAIVVGDEDALYRDRLTASGVNWISGRPPEQEVRATVKIRYLHAGAPAIVRPMGKGRVAVEFDDPQRAITPGQSVVFYQDRVVLGGGIIER
jgi:tRNA-specific 2-thiouridylase